MRSRSCFIRFMARNMCSTEQIDADKALLRKRIDGILSQLNEENIRSQSENVVRKVLAHAAYINAARISIYLSTSTEINTIPILKHALENGKECFVPRFEKNIMKMLRVKDMDDYRDLPSAKWGIKQPASDHGRQEALDNGGTLDLVLLPGVAFTIDGKRLGHGKGYYDTYLHKLHSNTVTIGLALREQIVDDLPTTHRDVTLNHVLYTVQ